MPSADFLHREHRRVPAETVVTSEVSIAPHNVAIVDPIMVQRLYGGGDADTSRIATLVAVRVHHRDTSKVAVAVVSVARGRRGGG